MAQVLASFDRSRVSTGRIENSSTVSQLTGLLHQTESWMARIVRPIQIDAEWFPNTSVTRLRFKTPGLRSEWTRAPNAGFGISYALPIIVAALRAEVGGLLLVENPEAHLHPTGQSRIGAFLAQVAADGVQIFLETHSDHVLNGIRVAVADSSAALLPEQVLIHFFRAEDDESPILQSMELKQTGQLSAWPSGFFRSNASRPRSARFQAATQPVTARFVLDEWSWMAATGVETDVLSNAIHQLLERLDVVRERHEGVVKHEGFYETALGDGVQLYSALFEPDCPVQFDHDLAARLSLALDRIIELNDFGLVEYDCRIGGTRPVRTGAGMGTRPLLGTTPGSSSATTSRRSAAWPSACYRGRRYYRHCLRSRRVPAR